jgi:hypothetical protein
VINAPDILYHIRGLTNIIRLSVKKMDSSEWEHIPVPSRQVGSFLLSVKQFWSAYFKLISELFSYWKHWVHRSVVYLRVLWTHMFPKYYSTNIYNVITVQKIVLMQCKGYCCVKPSQLCEWKEPMGNFET